MSKASAITSDEIATEATSRPWAEIEGHYRGAADPGPASPAMLRLVQDIRRSRLAQGLHAWTSQQDLCVAQQPVALARDLPHLRISSQPDGRLEFRYVDTTPLNRQWHVTVEGELAFERLAQFLERLHWLG